MKVPAFVQMLGMQQSSDSARGRQGAPRARQRRNGPRGADAQSGGDHRGDARRCQISAPSGPQSAKQETGHQYCRLADASARERRDTHGMPTKFRTRQRLPGWRSPAYRADGLDQARPARSVLGLGRSFRAITPSSLTRHHVGSSTRD